MKRATQRIRYLRTPDGVRLAWAEAGAGPSLVKAANWLTHLEYEWESPVWRHWIRFFTEHFRFVRYDERGCGMTDWKVGDLSFERWVGDLEAVVEASEPQEPFALLGISQGAATCLAYAVKHPERVSHLLLYGGYARGVFRRGDAERERVYRAIIDLVRLGWGKDNPAFRQVFTSRFIPGGSEEQLDWWNELCRKTTAPDIAARLFEARGAVEVTDLLGEVRTPTLVLHSRDDDITPITEGHVLAAGIPGAQFVELDSKNHVLLEHEPAWQRFREAVLEFTGLGVTADVDDSIYSLSTTTGQRKGSFDNVPAAKPFPFPYYETFESYSRPERWGHLPRYTADIAGAFEIAGCPDKKGKCLRQVVPAPTISWAPDWLPYTILGDDQWQDYEVSADVYLNPGEKAAVMGRVNHVGTGYGFIPKGYFLELGDDGGLRLVVVRGKVDKKKPAGDAEQQALIKAGKDEGEGGEKVLATVKLPNVGPNKWHNLKLRFEGSAITGLFDGKPVVSATDALYPRGMAGLLAGGEKTKLSTPYFDNVLIKATNAPAPKPSSAAPGQSPIYSTSDRLKRTPR